MVATYASNNVIENMPNQDVTASATATGATATATLAASTTGRTNVLTGFDVTASGTITAGTVTITGVGSGTLTYAIPTTLTNGLIVQFTSPLICSSGANSAISVACSSLGAATAFVNAYGFLI